jgi:hypothetical protein
VGYRRVGTRKHQCGGVPEEPDTARFKIWVWSVPLAATNVGEIVCVTGSQADADTVSCEAKAWGPPDPQKRVRRSHRKSCADDRNQSN